MSKFVHITNRFFVGIALAMAALFVGAPAQATDGGGANGSDIAIGHGEYEGVIGQPLEIDLDVPDVTPVVKMSWPKGSDKTEVSVTVDNRRGSKTYKAEVKSVFFASNDVFSSPTEATEALIGVDRKVSVKAGKVKTYKLFTFRSTTSAEEERNGESVVGTVTRAKGAKMTDLVSHQRISKAKGIALDSIFAMEIWPTTPDGPEISNLICPTWFRYPSLWGMSCMM